VTTFLAILLTLKSVMQITEGIQLIWMVTCNHQKVSSVKAGEKKWNDKWRWITRTWLCKHKVWHEILNYISVCHQVGKIEIHYSVLLLRSLRPLQCKAQIERDCISRTSSGSSAVPPATWYSLAPLPASLSVHLAEVSCFGIRMYNLWIRQTKHFCYKNQM
jgi:hypothetical protein